ncbi:hypothetical protein FWH30_02940 [Microgenomates group bacterium]|nr:hypothetical protein [Microgenomates group bacterium]
MLEKILTIIIPKVGAQSALGTISLPEGTKTSASDSDIDSVINTILELVFFVGVLLVLGNMIFGAYMWITSGGKSDKIAAGRNRMIWSVVGLVLLAASFAIAMWVQDMLIGDGGTRVLVP